jgi:hypothetical protein
LRPRRPRIPHPRTCNTGGTTCRRRAPDPASKKGGKSGSYDDWSKDDLQKRAAEIGIEGRSKMNKSELVKALRNH